MSETTQDVTFSFVVPLFNEQAGLEEFYARLTAAAGALGQPYEIIFVNDGSGDATGAILDRLRASDAKVKIVEFSRNFGHQVALTAGYDRANGKAVISLDGDCQHPPEKIADLVAKWREGYEVVYTVRTNTRGVSRLHRGLVRCGYRVISMLSGMDLTDQADFRLLDRKAVLALREHREQGRFVRGLVRYIGFRQAAVPYEAHRRAAGRSNYSLRQTARLAGAAAFNFSMKPVRAISLLGGAMLAAALLWGLLALPLAAIGLASMPGVKTLLVGLSGLNLLAIGIVGEYVGRCLEQVKGRPLYVIRRAEGFEKPAQPAVVQQQASKPQAQTAQPRYSIFT